VRVVATATGSRQLTESAVCCVWLWLWLWAVVIQIQIQMHRCTTDGGREPGIYKYEGRRINWSFLVAALNFVLVTLSSIVVSFYNKTPSQRRSHSRVFTPPSPREVAAARNFDTRGGLARIWSKVGRWCGDVQCQFWDFPVETHFGRSHPLTPLFTATEPLAQATDGGLGP
jgi:hypothetical protein